MRTRAEGFAERLAPLAARIANTEKRLRVHIASDGNRHAPKLLSTTCADDRDLDYTRAHCQRNGSRRRMSSFFFTFAGEAWPCPKEIAFADAAAPGVGLCHKALPRFRLVADCGAFSNTIGELAAADQSTEATHIQPVAALRATTRMLDKEGDFPVEGDITIGAPPPQAIILGLLVHATNYAAALSQDAVTRSELCGGDGRGALRVPSQPKRPWRRCWAQAPA